MIKKLTLDLSMILLKVSIADTIMRFNGNR